MTNARIDLLKARKSQEQIVFKKVIVPNVKNQAKFFHTSKDYFQESKHFLYGKYGFYAKTFTSENAFKRNHFIRTNRSWAAL